MNTLITDIQEITDYTGATVQLSVGSLKPYLSMARADKEVRKILTDELWDDLLERYTADELGDEGNEKYLALLPYVQKPLVLLAIYDYLLEGHSMITDAGITKSEQSSYRWQVEELKSSYIDKAYFALDELVQYLQRKADDFTDWKASSAYAATKAYFINTVVDFQRWVDIRESYRMLCVLRPRMYAIEQGRVKELLGKTEFDKLKQMQASDTLENTEYADLLEKVQPAMAYLSMAEAMEHLHIRLTPDGALVHSLAKNENSNLEEKQATAQELRGYYDKLKDKGEKHLDLLADYLNANASATKFKGYFDGDNYQTDAVEVRKPVEGRKSYSAINPPR